MTDIAALVADNLQIWTGAIQRKSGAGRGSGKRISLYGIERLRALILDLAVRGKLVPREVSGGARLPGTSPLEPFSVPAGWRWTTVGKEAESRLGKMLDVRKNKGVPKPYLRNANVRWFDFNLSDLFLMPFEEGELKEFALVSGDVMICEGGEPGRAAVWDGRAEHIYFQKAIHRVRFRGSVEPNFFSLTIKRSADLGELTAYFTGSGIQHLTGRNLARFAFPLPPLAEQRRIVAKVDALMALCDALERESADAIAAHQALVEALLATLVNSADAADLARQWARLKSHFDTLFTTDASIEALKQTILDLAVRGKLSSNIAVDWEPTALGAFVKDAEAGWSPKCIETPRSGTDWGVLKVSAVTWGRFQPAENKQLPPSFEPRPEIEVTPGDFLISRANTADLVARSVVVPNDAPAKLMMSDKIIRFRFDNRIDPEWVNLFHASTPARAYYTSVAGGTSSSMKNVSQAQIRALQLPVPPIAEQRRIVTKVGALMALCDALKARLADAAQTQRHLADAITERAAA